MARSAWEATLSETISASRDAQSRAAPFGNP
jgi:hypothetical protein